MTRRRVSVNAFAHACRVERVLAPAANGRRRLGRGPFGSAADPLELDAGRNHCGVQF